MVQSFLSFICGHRLPQHLLSHVQSHNDFLDAIYLNEDIHFYWSMLICDIENEDDSNELLKEVIKV